jgi:hypothetical protein
METNTARYAERELSILCKTVESPIIKDFIPEILALCEKFGKSGQSGGSAPFTATALSQSIKKLCLQEPICDITGIDDEWVQVREVSGDDEMMYQNNRCSALFKSKSGKCWYVDAITWKTQNGGCWGGRAILPQQIDEYGKLSRTNEVISSRQFVNKFPFKPKTFYIDVIEKEIAKDDWEFYIKDERQLEKVFKYYDKY